MVIIRGGVLVFDNWLISDRDFALYPFVILYSLLFVWLIWLSEKKLLFIAEKFKCLVNIRELSLYSV